MPGGCVRWEALSVVGQLGDGVFERVNVQKAFLGAAGFTLEAGPLATRPTRRRRSSASMVDAAREVIAHRRQHEVGAGRVRDVLPDRDRLAP